jgi:hypothetical protein
MRAAASVCRAAVGRAGDGGGAREAHPGDKGSRGGVASACPPSAPQATGAPPTALAPRKRSAAVLTPSALSALRCPRPSQRATTPSATAQTRENISGARMQRYNTASTSVPCLHHHPFIPMDVRVCGKVRSAEVLCEPGTFCAGGVRIACPAGQFGDVSGLSTAGEFWSADPWPVTCHHTHPHCSLLLLRVFGSVRARLLLPSSVNQREAAGLRGGACLLSRWRRLAHSRPKRQLQRWCSGSCQAWDQRHLWVTVWRWS